MEARERSGYFVIFRTGDGFAAAAPQVSRVRPEGKRENGGEPAFPFSVLAKTMRHVLSEMGESILARSPDACGCAKHCGSIWRAAAASAPKSGRSSSAQARNTCTG